MKILKKAGLAVIKDKKILMARSREHKEVFYTVGGKLDQGETDVDCLKREVKEELDVAVDESSLRFLAEFQDKAHGKENTFINIRLYEGKLIGEPKPSAEVVEIRYFDSMVDKKHLSPSGVKIVAWLKEKGMIS